MDKPKVIKGKKCFPALILSVMALVLSIIFGLGYLFFQFVFPVLCAPVVAVVLIVSLVAYILLPFVLLGFVIAVTVIAFVKLFCILMTAVSLLLGIAALIISLIMKGRAVEKELSVFAIIISGAVLLVFAALLLALILALLAVAIILFV